VVGLRLEANHTQAFAFRVPLKGSAKLSVMSSSGGSVAAWSVQAPSARLIRAQVGPEPGSASATKDQRTTGHIDGRSGTGFPATARSLGERHARQIVSCQMESRS
jgi:hypothetical protein